MTSIRRWLLGWLICGLAAASGIAAFGIFHTAREEANELFDYELRTVALSLPSNLETAETVERQGSEFEGISDDRILIEIWDKGGSLVYHSRLSPVLARLPAGIRTIERGEAHWRVLGLQQPDRFIQVAQPVSVREALALHLALHTLWPLGLLMPVTIVLVLFVVARGLAPIGGLSRSLATRSLDSLEPLRLDGQVPVEIRPLVDALNDLLQRLNAASQAQRTFIADAAHELRSPLAALKLQLQAASNNGTLKDDGQTIERIDTRLNRIIRLVQQLLTLAREDANPANEGVSVSLRKIGEQAVSDFSLLAEQKQIDLGLEFRHPVTQDNPCDVLADPHGVSVLLNNLIDNAIRYTPQGGRVDVVLCLTGERLGFDVVDTGPGIPERELERVLDRFYRGEHTKGTGSGLGLAIAARIAQRQQLTLKLANNVDAAGLTVSVRGFIRPGGSNAAAR
ncbi:two-component system, OmpR family, sensor kinase [Burkholderia sp. WP9]|uniref:ATP-binding protein n=1 Tax=Burkholderia sp. WP9 TaxID=1500263 RepID=UPI00089C9548|nr:ATP-binding protein [Burkholderia sp. WP9]SEE71050.1 two-component system, OmpR family, sensor kinase [Burkholderia sp. WP9]